jgi:hypothetical protein
VDVVAVTDTQVILRYDGLDFGLTPINNGVATHTSAENQKQDVFAFCRKVEEVVRAKGYHVALTGSSLYGHPDPTPSPKNDIDLIFYRHDNEPLKPAELSIIRKNLIYAGLIKERTDAWVVEAHWNEDHSGYKRLAFVEYTPDGMRVDLIMV